MFKHNTSLIKLSKLLALLIVLFFAKSAMAGGYANAVKRSIDSVVTVFTQAYANASTIITYDPRTNRLERKTKRAYLYPSGLGSGIILDDQGFIVTNYHVIKNADQIFVKIKENQPEIPVEVVGYDSESDIALLKIKFEKLPKNITLKPINIANSANLQVGDIVLAIGNPFGIGKTVTQGIVSAINRNNLGINTFENFIQIDAAINRGNSGGALVNEAGDLIGINSAIYSDNGSFAGLAFAIPSNMLLNIVSQIKKYGQVIRGWIGIQINELDKAVFKGLNINHGVVVTSILDNSPAFIGGLRVGDVIIEVNGKNIKSSRGLINVVSAIKPGTKVAITISRKNTKIQLKIRVRQRPNFIRR